MTTGGELLVRGLAAHSVGAVFGIPGTHSLEIYRHLGRYGVRHVTTRHEQGAGYAADGFARTTGRPGVVLTTSGPGVLNVVTAVAQAYSDSVPMLVVAPGPRTDQRRRVGALHEVADQRGALAAVAKAAHRAADHEELVELLALSFVEAIGGRPGPVYLEIPLDVLERDGETELRPILEPAALEADGWLVQEAGGLLSNAERPLLLLGGGARWSGAEALALAEALGASILTTINGKGSVPEDHPLCLGAALHLPAARRVVEESDVVLAVGTELAETDWWYGRPKLPLLIRVDIDAAQLARTVHPNIALHGEARRVLEELRAEIVAGKRQARDGAAVKREAAAEAKPWQEPLDVLRHALDRDAIVTADTARACAYGAIGSLPVHTPGAFCYPTGLATLGYAVPAALGAKTAHPDRQVVALSGDGGLMFSVQEIAAIAAEGLGIPIVVFADGGYGEIRARMRERGVDRVGVDLAEPDFEQLARALGGHGEEFSAAALADALHRDRPTLLVVRGGS